MPTADDLLRAAAARIDFEMRFYVGGKWSWADLDNIEAGQPYSPTVASTLAATVDEDDTSITLVDASAFTTGVVIIVPALSSQCYEMIAWTEKVGNVLSGLTRTLIRSDDPYSWIHNAGDAVVEWVEVTDTILQGDDRDELRESIASWTADVKGINYNSVLLDNDNAMLCMARFRPGASGSFDLWTDWAVYWLGFIREVRLDDDADHGYKWQATVASWYQYLETTDANGGEYGRIDLAETGSVTVSSTIVDPFTEAGEGEFIGSPDCEGEDAADGDMATLWMSEVIPLQTYAGLVSNCQLRINEMYLRPAPGLPTGLQWIEIVFNSTDPKDRINCGEYMLCTSATQWKLYDSSCDPDVDPGCLPHYAAAFNNFAMLPSDVLLSPGDFLIMTSDKPAFLQRWGTTEAKLVFDWNHRQTGAFTLNPASGRLGLFFQGMVCDDAVFWGAEGHSAWYFLEDDEHNEFTCDLGWTGDNLPTMSDTECPVGNTYRRNPDGQYDEADSKDNFAINPSTPVYAESDPTPGRKAANDDPEWISINLGALGLTLEEELPADQTTYAQLSGTLGLTQSGRIQIDFEQIDYATRDDENDQVLTLTRGAGRSTPALHPIGSTIYQVESGVALDCHLVSHVGWRRRNVVGTTPVIPMDFDILFSALESPMLPDDEDWATNRFDYWPAANWIRQRNYQGTSPTVCFDKTIEPVRARHFLMLIHEMSDQGRVKLNEVNVYTPTPTAGDGNDLVWSGDVLYDLLVNVFGIPAANVVLTDPGMSYIGFTVTKQPYSQIIADLLKRTGCILIFGRDNIVEHRYDPRLMYGNPPDIDIEWTTANTQDMTVTRPFRHSVKQIVLRANEPSLDEGFEVRYPVPALDLGVEEQVEDVICGSMDAAITRAQLLFLQKNGALIATINPVGLGEWIRPGQRHTVTWTADTEGTYLQGRNFVVTSVHRSYSFGTKTEPPTWSINVELEELFF